MIDPHFSAGRRQLRLQPPHQRFIFPGVADEDSRFVGLRWFRHGSPMSRIFMPP